MSSLRIELELTMGLKFPEQNGEPLVRFEESMEIPRSAETLMRGLYRDPEKIRRSFQNLHQETATILEILMPRRSRLREWSEELPDRPNEAENFIKETSEQIMNKHQLVSQIESELLSELQDSGLKELFPIQLQAFGVCSYRDPSVKIFLRPLGRLAEILELNPEQLRYAVRVHFLFMLLLISGLDLDEQKYIRGEDPVTQLITCAHTYRFLKKQSAELINAYNEWLKAWGGKKPSQVLIGEFSAEKLRAATIFWRRQTNLSWEDCWQVIDQIGKHSREARDFFSGNSIF